MRLLLGLGGNLGDPDAAFAGVLRTMSGWGWRPTASATVGSAPVGPPQPSYRNAVVLVVVDLPLPEVHARCRGLEEAAGRRREAGERWGPRPLDIDLLLADGVVHHAPELVVPHPRLAGRAFALVPAAELAPGWLVPGTGRTVGELAVRVDRSGLSPR